MTAITRSLIAAATCSAMPRRRFAIMCLTARAISRPRSTKTAERLRKLVVRFGLDPTAERRTRLENLEFHERELRQLILSGLRDNRWTNWDDGLDNTDVKTYIAMRFRLREPKVKGLAGDQTPNKHKGGHRYQPYSPAPTGNPKGRGKGKQGGKGKGSFRLRLHCLRVILLSYSFFVLVHYHSQFF